MSISSFDNLACNAVFAHSSGQAHPGHYANNNACFLSKPAVGKGADTYEKQQEKSHSMTYKENLLAHKTAVVTGGYSGIGAGIAGILAGLGAHVIVAGIRPADAELKEHPNIVHRELDVCDQAAAQALIEDLDRLDILVNCAGIIFREAEHQLDVFERVVSVNLVGTMRLCSLARAKLAETEGCIVNLASMLSFFGGALVPAYSASKGGVMQLTKSLALAYAPDRIRVNAVAPGWIATPLTSQLQADRERTEAILARTPMGRWGNADDVAQAVVFLCSPAASFVTGIILPVDGGYMAA